MRSEIPACIRNEALDIDPRSAAALLSPGLSMSDFDGKADIKADDTQTGRIACFLCPLGFDDLLCFIRDCPCSQSDIWFAHDVRMGWRGFFCSEGRKRQEGNWVGRQEAIR